MGAHAVVGFVSAHVVCARVAAEAFEYVLAAPASQRFALAEPLDASRGLALDFDGGAWGAPRRRSMLLR